MFGCRMLFLRFRGLSWNRAQKQHQAQPPYQNFGTIPKMLPENERPFNDLHTFSLPYLCYRHMTNDMTKPGPEASLHLSTWFRRRTCWLVTAAQKADKQYDG